jgi:hypothetical protein
MRALYLAVIAVLISGCITTTNTGMTPQIGGAGIVIEKFSIEPNKIYEGQSAVITLKLRNNGEADVTDGNIVIYGYDPGEFSLNPSNKVNFDLKGVDKTLGISGQELIKSWKVSFTGDLSAKQILSYNFFARVCYTYTTKGFGKVEVMSEDEYLRRVANNEITQTPIQIENTNSPVKVSIEGTHPIVSSSGEFSFKLRIENVGQGYLGPCYPTTFENLNNVSIRITLGSVSCEHEQEVYLQRGKSQEIVVSCSNPTISVPLGTNDLMVELTYPYYQDVQTALLVEGK